MNEIDRRLKRILGLARQASPKSTADPAPPFLARQVFERWQNEPPTDSSRSRFRPALVLAGGAVLWCWPVDSHSCCGPASEEAADRRGGRTRGARRESQGTGNDRGATAGMARRSEQSAG